MRFVYSMIRWKRMTGFLYQNKLSRERAKQRRDRERESVRDRALLEMRDSVGNKIDR
jgi:hypothetical protein